jgi:hypothetical protein
MALNGVPICDREEGGNVPLDEQVLQHFDSRSTRWSFWLPLSCSGDFTTKR